MFRRIVAATLAALFFAQAASADLIILRNRDRYQGTIANSRELGQLGNKAGDVSIMAAADSSGHWTIWSFEPSEIDYVIMEWEGRQRVVDFNPAPGAKVELVPWGISANDPAAIYRQRPAMKKTHRGITIALVGVALAATGGLVKFGGPTYTSKDEYVEKSYNGVNLMMMFIGSGMIVGGLGFAIMENGSTGSRTAYVGTSVRF